MYADGTTICECCQHRGPWQLGVCVLCGYTPLFLKRSPVVRDSDTSLDGDIEGSTVLKEVFC